jgi:hypothetical protein
MYIDEEKDAMITDRDLESISSIATLTPLLIKLSF